MCAYVLYYVVRVVVYVCDVCVWFEPGEQGGTYTGQPLSMAVGKAVLEEILNKKLVEHCHRMGKLIKKYLSELSKKYEIINIKNLKKSF